VSGPYGYPKSLRALLGVELTSQEATVKGVAVRRYLRAIPVDPLMGKNEWRLRCYQDPPTADSWCGTDIYDVSTKSEDVALDGTKYKDW
jgi:general secretion pathway protein G